MPEMLTTMILYEYSQSDLIQFSSLLVRSTKPEQQQGLHREVGLLATTLS